jgi:hypothetical protein
MTLKTWNASNGSFTNPKDWTPQGVPVSADTADITNGTVRIRNLDLTDVTMQVSSQSQSNPATLDIRNSTIGNLAIVPQTSQQFPVADINIRGTATEDGFVQLGDFSSVVAGSTLDVTVANRSTFINTGTINEGTGSTLDVTGRGTFENDGTFNVQGSEATIDTPITGTGTINAEIGIDTRATQLTIGGSVSAGETVNVIGNAVLQLSDTPEFLGEINFAPPPPPGVGLEEVILQGIASTAASYNGSVLSVFNGPDLVASLRVATPDGLTVTSSGGNTFIAPDGPIVAAHALG